MAGTIAVPAPAAGQEAAPGWLIVADQGAQRLELIAPDGTTTPLVTGGADPPIALRGIAVSPDGARLAMVDAGGAPGEGSIAVVSAGGGYEPVATGLDFPEGVMWLDDETILFSSFTTRTISSVPAAGGEPGVIAELPSSPTGLSPVVIGAQSGVVVATYDGPAYLADPATGQVQPVTDPLAGGGLAAMHPSLGLCVPELEADRVRCFPVNGAPPTQFGPLEAPVAVAVAGDQVIVTSPAGVFAIDPGDGTLLPVTAALRNPAGVAVLGNDPGAWAPLAAVPETTVAEPTTSSTADPATTVTTSGPPTTKAAPATTAPAATSVPATTVPATTSPPPIEASGPAGAAERASRLPWGFFVAAGILLLALAAVVMARLRREWNLRKILFGVPDPPDPPPPPPPPPTVEPLNPDERSIGTETAVRLAAADGCDHQAFWKAYSEGQRSVQMVRSWAEDYEASGRPELAAAARRRAAAELADLDRARDEFTRRCPDPRSQR